MFNKRSLFFPHSSAIGSMKAGVLYPFLCREMYPNDKIIISHEALLKAAPMLFPIYSPMKLTIDYFFNENRNVWRGNEATDWSAFFTGSVNGKAIDNPDELPQMPTITVPSGGFAPGSLGDYLGFNSEPALAGAQLSALRFRHYQKICSDFYLDENFSTMPTISFDQGPDTTTSLELQYRCWNKDRFTTASLEPQKGISVGIPLAGSIPVVSDGTPLKFSQGNSSGNLKAGQISTATVVSMRLKGGATNDADIYLGGTSGETGLKADISNTEPISIDELHFLVQVERLQQRDDMWGTRDFESIYTHFGCRVPDSRLQRATHLGRTVVDVHFSEVLQTSQTTDGADGSPQGNITGHTLAVSQSNPVRFHCKEHGFLFVIVNVQPIAQYQQGVPRDALYKTRYDLMWPVLSETGLQELFSAEIYATKANVDSRKIFGFEPRYNHLRFGEKTVHGDFRTNLNAYHTGRIFTSEPNLNEQFVKADPTNRMFAVEFGDVDPWWLRMEFNIKHVRRLPKWPTPSSIGKLF